MSTVVTDCMDTFSVASALKTLRLRISACLIAKQFYSMALSHILASKFSEFLFFLTSDSHFNTKELQVIYGKYG